MALGYTTDILSFSLKVIRGYPIVKNNFDLPKMGPAGEIFL